MPLHLERHRICLALSTLLCNPWLDISPTRPLAFLFWTIPSTPCCIQTRWETTPSSAKFLVWKPFEGNSSEWMQRKIDVTLKLGAARSSDPQARVLNPNLNEMVMKLIESWPHRESIEMINTGPKNPSHGLGRMGRKRWEWICHWRIATVCWWISHSHLAMSLIGKPNGKLSVSQNAFSSMTKIIGTLGPQSRDVETISKLLNAGMSGMISSKDGSVPCCALCLIFCGWI